MRNPLCALLRPCRIAAVLSLLALCGTAFATPVISTTTRAGTSSAATGTAISGRAPLPVVVDAGSGTTTTHSTGNAEQVAIRFDEKKYTTCTYTHATLTITCPNNAFTTFSNEVASISTNGATNWTASDVDAGAYRHDNVAGVHGKPVGVRVGNSDVTEGTCGSLANGQWGWCNPQTLVETTGTVPNANVVYVQDAAGDPDGQASGFVEIIYGDGEYLEVQHADWNSGNPTYVYVDVKSNDDDVVLMAAPSGASADETNVTVFQAVNPWTDLRYNYSVSCPNGTGGACIEDITNGDQRPGLVTTAIDETVGRGPIWAFVFKEGFGADAVITITANDDANGDTQDSQTIDVDETAWTGSTDYYISAAGNDTTGDGSIGNPWLTWTKLCDSLRTVSGARRGFLNRGDTFTETTNPVDWNSETDETLFMPYGSGADPIVTKGTGAEILEITENDPNTRSANIRFVDIDFRKTAGTANMLRPNGNRNLVMRCSFTLSGSGAASEMLSRGTAGTGYQDSVVWDNIFSCTNTSAQYGWVDSASTDTEKTRVAFVGNSWDHGGGASTSSVLRTNHVSRSFWAYNKWRRNFASSSNPAVRINYSSGVYLFSNYVIADGQSEIYTNGCGGSCGPGTASTMLVDGDFWDMTGSTVVSSGFGIDVDQDARAEPEGPMLFRNVICDGGDKFATLSGTAGQAAGTGIRFFNNTFYTTDPNGVKFLGEDGTSDYANLKFANNIMRATVNNASNFLVDNDGNFARLPNVQILNNVWSIGASGTMANVDGVTYTNPANWTAASGKAAQVDIESDPLLALPASNDFRLCTASGVPDASCSGASPCIDAGYDLPTVYYDYSGAVRNSDDVGAWDDDSGGSGAGSGAATRGMLIGVW